jgi:hypothetical protein
MRGSGLINSRVTGSCSTPTCDSWLLLPRSNKRKFRLALGSLSIDLVLAIEVDEFKFFLITQTLQAMIDASLTSGCLSITLLV